MDGGPATIKAAFEHLCAAQAKGGGVPMPDRLGQLKALRRTVKVNAEAIAQAIDADFGGRSKYETRLSEIGIVLAAIDHALKRTGAWARDEKVNVGWRFWPARAFVRKQPLGIVGIIAPWNYPVQLSLLPLVGALSAGCRALVKPSEHVPRTAALLARIARAELDRDICQVVEGDAAASADLAALPLDKLMFTGSTEIGRRVMQAAAPNLTPLLLELGGKSPAIIDGSADLDAAARDIIAGKLLNAGQTCVAPDYVWVPRDMAEHFVAAAKRAARKLYPDRKANDLTAICRKADYDRLRRWSDVGRSVPLLDEGLAEPKMSPVLVMDPPRDAELMTREIFGPVLPVLSYDDVEEVVAFIAERPAPLALYWFGTDRNRQEAVLSRTRSGGVSINDTVLHVAVEELPFGGVGASGMGAYHGRAGFEAFTHRRAIFVQHDRSPTRLLRPPYGRLAERMTQFMIR